MKLCVRKVKKKESAAIATKLTKFRTSDSNCTVC